MTHKTTFFVVGAIFLFLAGFLLGQQELLFMSCMLLAVLLTAHLVASYSVRRLAAQVRAPLRFYEQETRPLRLSLTNLSRLPKFFLSVLCRAAEGLSVTPTEGHFLPWLPPRGSSEVKLSLTAARRGVYQLGPVQVTSSDPVGTAEAQASPGEAVEIIVYPSFPRVETAPIPSGAKMGFYQEQEYPMPGRGREFHFIRPYQPGDEFRRIHWKTTARTGNISVIEPERPAVNSVSAFFYFPADSLAGSGSHTNLEYAIKIAAGMAWAVLKAGGRFEITALGKSGLLTAQARHLGELERILEVLARTEVSPDSHCVLERISGFAARNASPDNLVVFVGRADEALGNSLSRVSLRSRNVTLFLADQESFAERSDRPQWLQALASGARQAVVSAPEAADPRRAGRPKARWPRPRVIRVHRSSDLSALVRQGCLVG